MIEIITEHDLVNLPSDQPVFIDFSKAYENVYYELIYDPDKEHNLTIKFEDEIVYEGSV